MRCTRAAHLDCSGSSSFSGFNSHLDTWMLAVAPARLLSHVCIMGTGKASRDQEVVFKGGSSTIGGLCTAHRPCSTAQNCLDALRIHIVLWPWDKFPQATVLDHDIIALLKLHHQGGKGIMVFLGAFLVFRYTLPDRWKLALELVIQPLCLISFRGLCAQQVQVRCTVIKIHW